MAWLMLAGAGMRLRRSRLSAQKDGPAIRKARAARVESLKRRRSWRSLNEHSSPIAWLVARQPELRVTVWCAALMLSSYPLSFLTFRWLLPAFAGGPPSFALMAWLPNLVFGAIGA